MSNKSKSRALSPAELENFGQELDALRAEIVASLGLKEARYIRRIQDFVRYSEIGGRGLLYLSFFPPAWLAGTGLLGVSKIVENMELGHNVMHGQYDWLNEPALRGDTYDWDTACAGDAWRKSHNYMHHTYTNVDGVDRDIGYGFLRLFPSQKWHAQHLTNPAFALLLALGFEWFVALHDLELDQVLSGKKKLTKAELRPVLKKARRQVLKDYVFFPALGGPLFVPVLAGNFAANLIRNVWAFSIIFCGHFTADAETFPEESLKGETRGQWYRRQLRGSSNLTGGKIFHILTGNLSHQIEHHLFPDLPGMRYADMSVRVREICERYGQHYNSGSFWRQFGSVVARIMKYSLPTPNETVAAAA